MNSGRGAVVGGGEHWDLVEGAVVVGDEHWVLWLGAAVGGGQHWILVLGAVDLGLGAVPGSVRIGSGAEHGRRGR